MIRSIALSTTIAMLLMATAVQAEPGDGQQSNVCVEDICVPVPGMCEGGYRESPPDPSQLEVGVPQGSGWYIICIL
jgi:hypothetical protein